MVCVLFWKSIQCSSTTWSASGSRFDPTVYTWHGLPVYYGSYGDDPHGCGMAQAWQITWKVHGEMRQTVEADGAKFVVLAQASHSASIRIGAPP